MNDALAVIVNHVGIPILVRPYGQAQIPATAAIGIVNAIFDAALSSERHVAYLETAQYRVAYHHTNDGWLLTLFNSELVPRQQSRVCLLWLDRMLRLVLRPSLFASTDPGSQKFEVAKHVQFIDYIMTHQDDLEFAIGMPLTTASNTQVFDVVAGMSWPGPTYVIDDGVVLMNNADSVDEPFDCWLVVLLVVAAELILEQPPKSAMQFPVYINAEMHHMTVVDIPSNMKRLVWFGVTNNELKVSTADVQRRLDQWPHPMPLPSPWFLSPAIRDLCPSLLG
ncbi:hypothetical protein AaE_013163, partial [Aphanomyces astaci]